jgi:hypothetical protein
VARYIRSIIHGIDNVVDARIESDMGSVMPWRLGRRAPWRRHDEVVEEVEETTLAKRVGPTRGLLADGAIQDESAGPILVVISLSGRPESGREPIVVICRDWMRPPGRAR